ncbi:MAG: diguanylate cyclase response regulator, partial [Actinobacteria bacterium]|nr:diguanylate cyclase response regulator [Actinomycetota bacterium]
VLVCTPDQAEPMCASLVKAFDDVVPSFYDPADAQRGFLDITDRRGEPRRHPLVSVSIGVAIYTGGDRDHRAVVAAASEMKGVAKAKSGSVVAVDRRA